MAARFTFKAWYDCPDMDAQLLESLIDMGPGALALALVFWVFKWWLPAERQREREFVETLQEQAKSQQAAWIAELQAQRQAAHEAQRAILEALVAKGSEP